MSSIDNDQADFAYDWPSEYEIIFDGRTNKPSFVKPADEKWLTIQTTSRVDLNTRTWCEHGWWDIVCFDGRLYFIRYTEKNKFTVGLYRPLKDTEIADWSIPVSLGMISERLQRRMKEWRLKERRKNEQTQKEKSKTKQKDAVNSDEGIGSLVIPVVVIVVLVALCVGSCGVQYSGPLPPGMPR